MKFKKKSLKYLIKKIGNCQDVHVLQDDCAKIQIPENSILHRELKIPM